MNQKLKQQVINSLEINYLTKAQQDKILDLFMDNVAAKVNLVIWGAFLKEDKIKLIKMARVGNKKLLTYVSSRIDNFPKLVEKTTKETIEDFKRKKVQLS